jgi:hypothetical protein
MNDVNVGYFILAGGCVWHLLVFVAGWRMCLRFQKRGFAAFWPNFGRYVEEIKNDGTRIFPTR